jgi:hypothetical protein
MVHVACVVKKSFVKAQALQDIFVGKGNFTFVSAACISNLVFNNHRG